MKKLYLTSVAAAALSLCGLSVSCGRGDVGGASSGLATFTERTDSAAYLMPDLGGDSVYAIATFSLVWPESVAGIAPAALQDSLLSCAFGNPGPDFATASVGFLATGVEEAYSGVEHKAVSMDEARDAERVSLAAVSSRVAWLSPRLLVMGVDSYGYYYGAAHGYKTTRYVNYSPVSGEVVTADGFFDASKSDAIIGVIRRVAAELYPDGIVKASLIADYGTFRLTDAEVVFVYQPYDIAPYSLGVVEIPVGFYELSDYITPRGLKVLGFPE